MILFNSPYVPKGNNLFAYEMFSNKFSGEGAFSAKCHSWFNDYLSPSRTLLTTSCTHALEIMALLADISPGDEVILPSFTFASTANAFALRGAKLVFVDIRPDTMNIDEKLIANSITKKTKAIVVVHYAGVSCEMDIITNVAKDYELFLLEDAAQAMTGTYKGKLLGTFGQLGAFSFHETKNYHCGEGGLLIINDLVLLEKAEMVREKGTDRAASFRSGRDRYSWQTLGSSYSPTEFSAAFLSTQLSHVDIITKKRLYLWSEYHRLLGPLSQLWKIELPTIPEGCEHNAHIFYIKLKDMREKLDLILFLKENNICASSHYSPLHASPAGKKYGCFHGEDVFTTRESERLLRLPLYFSLEAEDVHYICRTIESFLEKKG